MTGCSSHQYVTTMTQCFYTTDNYQSLHQEEEVWQSLADFPIPFIHVRSSPSAAAGYCCHKDSRSKTPAVNDLNVVSLKLFTCPIRKKTKNFQLVSCKIWCLFLLHRPPPWLVEDLTFTNVTSPLPDFVGGPCLVYLWNSVYMCSLMA